MRARRAWIAVAVVAAITAGVGACDRLLGGSDLHVGECNPGERQCAGDLERICGADSLWGEALPCGDQQQTCVAGVGCSGSCSSGERRCAGDTPERCDSLGRWILGEKCAAGDCFGGICGATTCAPGKDLRCVSHQLEDCDATGHWQPRGEPCCGFCDPAGGGTCESDGNPCDEDDDVCSVDSACLKGTCKSTNGDHAWAHWDPRLGPEADPPSPRYTWSDHVVFDVVTHLTWQRVPAGASSWSSARKYCEDLDAIPGYPPGWRLPTRIELASIVDYSATQAPFIDTAAFPGTPSEGFWTSSTYADDASFAWYVLFLTGGVTVDYANFQHRVRCVR